MCIVIFSFFIFFLGGLYSLQIHSNIKFLKSHLKYLFIYKIFSKLLTLLRTIDDLRSKVHSFYEHSYVILISLKTMTINNDTSAEFVLMSPDVLLTMVIVKAL